MDNHTDANIITKNANCCVCGNLGVISNYSSGPLSLDLDPREDGQYETATIANTALWPIHKSYQGIVSQGELPVKIHSHFPDVPKIRLLDQSSALCTDCFRIIHNVLQLEKQMLRMKAKIQVKVGSELEIVAESKLFSLGNNEKITAKNKGSSKELQRKRQNKIVEAAEVCEGLNIPICHATRAKRKAAFAGLSREVIFAELDNEESSKGHVANTKIKDEALQATETSGLHQNTIANTRKPRSCNKLSRPIHPPASQNIDTQLSINDEERKRNETSSFIPTNEKFFNCPRCCVYYKKQDFEKFKAHISSECHIRKPFACELCGHIFSSNRVLTYHQRTVHEKPHPNSKTIQVKPRSEYVSEMSRIYELLQNSGTTIEVEGASGGVDDPPSIDTLLEQVEKEIEDDEWPTGQKSAETLGKASGSWKCWICFYESHQKSFWLNHMNRIHPNAKGKSLECQYCKFTFASKHHLREHLHEAHADKVGYKCGKCGRNFLHKKSRHFCVTIICDICGANFDSKGARNKHMLSHEEHRPYSCEVCSKTFQKQEYYALHMRIHNDVRPYTCEFCSKTFRSKSHYNNHRRIHTGEKPYICHTCGKSLSSPQSLCNHLQSHNEDKRFCCAICDKSFRTSYDVKRHQVIHSGAKPFECKVCKKQFNRRGNCMAHERKHIKTSSSKPAEVNIEQPKTLESQNQVKRSRKQTHSLRQI